MYILQKTQKLLHNLLLGLFSYGRRMKDFSHPFDLVNLVLQGKLLIPPPLKNVDVIFVWPLFQKLLKICCNKKMLSYACRRIQDFSIQSSLMNIMLQRRQTSQQPTKVIPRASAQLSTTLDALWGCINHTYLEWFLLSGALLSIKQVGRKKCE